MFTRCFFSLSARPAPKRTFLRLGRPGFGCFGRGGSDYQSQGLLVPLGLAFCYDGEFWGELREDACRDAGSPSILSKKGNATGNVLAGVPPLLQGVWVHGCVHVCVETREKGGGRLFFFFFF